MEAVHIDGLMHLAAIAVAVSIGYVGVDRIHPGARGNALEAAIEATRLKVEALLTILNPIDHDGSIKPIVNMPEMHILIHVAKKNGINLFRHPLQFVRKSHPVRCIKRQRYVPLLGYFKNRLDLRIIAWLCILETLLFILLSAIDIWNIGSANLYYISIDMSSKYFLYYSYITLSFNSNYFLGSSFSLYSGILMWIMLSVGASYQLRNIGTVCEEMANCVRNRVNQTASESMSMSLSMGTHLPMGPPDEK